VNVDPSDPGPRIRSKRSRLTIVVLALTIAVLAISVPGSIREAREHGAFYLFSLRFFEDLPKRLAGPGRLRFVIQPLLAILVGWRAGRADARAGRRAFLRRLLFQAGERASAAVETLEGLGVLLLMGVLLDSVFQWVLLGISYPGAALVVGPTLITLPYLAVRLLAESVSRGPSTPGPE
jgi:hypothetical protein